MGQRTRRSKDLKFKVAIEAVQGDRQVAEIAAEYGVHPQQVRDWKRQLLDQGADVFSGKQDAERKQLSEERDRLYQKVGELQVKNDFLKKVLGSRTNGAPKDGGPRASSALGGRAMPTLGRAAVDHLL